MVGTKITEPNTKFLSIFNSRNNNKISIFLFINNNRKIKVVTYNKNHIKGANKGEKGANPFPLRNSAPSHQKALSGFQIY